MYRMRASQAKQSFGELLRRAAHEPVAIERHKRIEAIVMPPGALPPDDSRALELAERRLARARQQLMEHERLIRHHRIALDLATLPAAGRRRLIAQARSRVAQWREKGTSSRDYIDRWTEILALPPAQVARAIVSDLGGWGTALRQNSPFHGMLPE